MNPPFSPLSITAFSREAQEAPPTMVVWPSAPALRVTGSVLPLAPAGPPSEAAELGREAELIQLSSAVLKAVRQRAARVVPPSAAGHGAVPAAEWDEAEAEAGAVATADERVQALSVLLDACITSGDVDRAVYLARTLRTAAAALEAPWTRCADVQRLTCRS